MKKVLLKIADILGFNRSTEYVKGYLHKANIRSGLFMAAVVAILEVWLIVRQHLKYIIPKDLAKRTYFDALFYRTSLFWLLMIMAISMFLYCLFYLKEKKNKGLLISVIVFSSIGIILCCLLPLETMIKEYKADYLVSTILLIILYAAVLAYHIVTIIATILKYRGKKVDWLQAVTVITIFATCLLVFGIRVSYGDFTSNIDGVPNPDYKQIICFLMMAIYVGCLLIWRPYISIAIIGAIFAGFSVAKMP